VIRFLRALRFNCEKCRDHGGYFYQGHWTRCDACPGFGAAS
jgi:hypothetical protein